MRVPDLRPGAAAAAVTVYALAVAVAVLALSSGGTDPVAVASLGLLGAAGLAMGVGRYVRRRHAELARLAEGVQVAVAANPAHRLPLPGDGDGSLATVAAAVNRLADAREEALRDAETTAASLRSEIESERNRLADLMARLGVAVVVCNADGRILLYNEAARSLVGDPALLGLGRTVFGLVDRGLIGHAEQRLDDSDTYTATTLHRGRTLRVHVAATQEPSEVARPGLVLVLEDLTEEMVAADERERAWRRLTEETRASLGSIRAAAEALLEFPDVDEERRRRFLEAVREETDRLGRRLDGTTAGVRPAVEHGLDDITAADLAALLADRLRRDGVACCERPSPGAATAWLHADVHALAVVLSFVAERLGGPALENLDLAVVPSPTQIRLDLRWTGVPPPSPTMLARWLDEPLGREGATTGRQVVDRHAAELWAGGNENGVHLSLLLPRDPEGTEVTAVDPGTPAPPATAFETPAPAPGSRPEFYDFDLFRPGSVTGEPGSAPLDELTFTVLDTETTGLDPDRGDRVVSVGAVRVVNGRVLRQETFEQLVNPGRRVPAAATAIHGLTDAMLADAPTIGDVLPELARFAADTVLVGHDIAFDLRFLEPAIRATGVGLNHPALDTLLLDVAVHPGQPDHTLEAIATRLGVSVVGRHTALGDALVTAEVLVALLGTLQEAGIRTLDDALAASRRALRSRAAERPGKPV